MNITEKKIDEIRPYWRNPRKNDGAVEAVKASIEKFGYNSPIVVDLKGVIIAGHTRYKALRELGYETVQVVTIDIPEDKARQYRIADNKTAEKAKWDDDLLTFELREIEELRDMADFFETGKLESLLGIRNIFEEDEDETDQDDADAFAFGAYRSAEPVQNPNPEAYPEVEREMAARRGEELAKAYAHQQEIENEKLAKRLKEQEEENQKIKMRELEMKADFAKRDEQRQNELLEVTCPHCQEAIMISRGELLRKDKIMNGDGR